MRRVCTLGRHTKRHASVMCASQSTLALLCSGRRSRDARIKRTGQALGRATQPGEPLGRKLALQPLEQAERAETPVPGSQLVLDRGRQWTLVQSLEQPPALSNRATIAQRGRDV